MFRGGRPGRPYALSSFETADAGERQTTSRAEGDSL
jgi:hypothetical protein